MLMKKNLGIVFAVGITMAALIGCGSSNSGGATITTASSEKSPDAETSTAKRETTIEIPDRSGMDFGEYNSSNPLRIRIATLDSGTSHKVRWVNELAANLEAAGNGAIACEVFTDGTMGQDREMLENVMSGVIELSLNNSSMLSNWDPKYSLFDLAYLFNSWEHALAFVESDYNQEIGKWMEPYGVVCLGFGMDGFRNWVSNKPIYTVADCKGQIIRSMESTYYMKAYEAFGASPTVMAGSEIMTALQQGTIDGQDNVPSVTLGQGFWEFSDYYSCTEHFAQFSGFCANVQWMNNLPDDLSQLIADVVYQTNVAHSHMQYENDQSDLKALEDKGLTIVRPDEIDKDSLKDTQTDIWKTYTDEFGSDLLNEIQALNE